MDSQVYYRKYRPRTFSEVCGQDHITQTLRNAIASGRVAHAYLFCGPRGTGKTSTGRILAKAVNCLKPVGGEPCGNCPTCQAYAEGRAMDIIEIDAASNRGIDDIRDLRQNAAYSPTQARYKVYIVDEVHMLSDPASNALLKTLEEPPPHIIFVLATTESHKVLATILSRCQRFDFRRLPQRSVSDRLSFICGGEGIEVPAEGLNMVARAATGSLRDAANLLEQLVAYYGKRISLAQVREMLGVSGDARVRELARCVLSRDAAGGLKTIAALNNDGLDLRQFNRELVQYLRDLLLIKSGSEEVIDATVDDIAEMKKAAAGMTLDMLLKAVRLFNDIDSRLDGYTPLPLELAVIESTLAEEKQLPKSAKPVEPMPRSPAPVAPVRPGGRTQNVAATGVTRPVEKAVDPPAPAQAKAPEKKVEPVMASPVKPKPAAEPEVAPVAVPAGNGQAVDIEYMRAHWKEFVDSLRGEGPGGNIVALLRGGEPVSIDDGVLTLGFYYDFHKSQIEDPKNRSIVEKKASDALGKPYQVRCVLIERSKKEAAAHGQDNYMAKAAMKLGAKIIAKKPVTEEG